MKGRVMLPLALKLAFRARESKSYYPGRELGRRIPMRMSPECVPCIYRVRTNEILASNLTDDEKIKALKEFTLHYSQVIESSSTVITAWKALRRVKEILNEDDPYREFKERSQRSAIRLARSLAEKAEELVGYERFRYLLGLSVAANLIDPGSPHGTDPEAFSEKAARMVFGRDETDRLYLLLLRCTKVTYLLDNCGEAVFDALVMRELRRMGLKLKIIARGAPCQNDVTYGEALKLGLHEYGEVVSTGTDFVGIVPGYVSGEAIQALEWADVVISKGMANFESFLYAPPKSSVFVLLVAKCQPIARAAGVRVGEAAAFFLRGPPSMQHSL
jgi:uncharacterized protein with ATP-grasp and redox domains